MRLTHLSILLCSLLSLWITTASLAQNAAKTNVAADLKSVGMALQIYCAQFEDRLPSNLGMVLPLAAAPDHVAEALQHFVPGKPIPDEILKAPLEKQCDWVNQNTVFVFLLPSARLNSQPHPSDTPVVFEKPASNPTAEKLSVLYADGHVALQPRKDVEALMAIAATLPAPPPPMAPIVWDLRIVGSALTVYTTKNKARFPQNLGQSLEYATEGNIAQALPHFAPGQPVPADILKAPIEKQRDWVNQNTPFQLLQPSRRMSDFMPKTPDVVPLVIEKPASNPTAEKLHILYVDGHVALQPRKDVEAMMPPPQTQPTPPPK